MNEETLIFVPKENILGIEKSFLREALEKAFRNARQEINLKSS
jgi:hypothetical protein